MKQSKKINQWYFDIKTYIGVDSDSCLVDAVRGTAGNVNNLVEANSLPYNEEAEVWRSAGYQGTAKRPDAQDGVRWNIAMRPGKRGVPSKDNVVDALINKVEKLKASIRIKVQPPVREIMCQFENIKMRYCGLKKNTAQLHTLLALSNLWMARQKLIAMQAWVHLQFAK